MLWMVWPVILSNRFYIQPSPKFLLKGLCAIRSCNNCAKPPLNFKKKLTTHKKSLQQIPTTREFEATGIGDAASCETPCKRKLQSDWAQLGDSNAHTTWASERVSHDCEERKTDTLRGAIENKKPKLLFELEPGQLFRLELIQHLFWRVQCHNHSVGVDEQWSKSFVLFPRFHQLGTSLVACVELWVCVQTVELTNLIP